MTTVLLVLMLHAAPASDATAPPQATTTQAPRQGAGDYKVGPQDKLNIHVLNLDVFSAQNVLVDNDGTFMYLDLGRIVAADKTLREIAAAVSQLLIDRKQHMGPTVTVDVAEYRSQMVYVSGAVANSRGITIRGNETLLGVLAQAGFIPSSGTTVEVTRNKPTPGQKFVFKRKDLEMGIAEPFRLQDQDSIFVPEAEKAFVTGEVKAPGPIDVGRGDMTLLQVITLAGGITDRGSKGKIEVTRKDADGKEFKVKVDTKKLSTIIKPGDTIHVGKRWF
jgi:protein involved in polysaccharide export with SLBB domain